MNLSTKDNAGDAIEAIDADDYHVEFVFAERPGDENSLEAALAMLSANYAEKSIVR